MISKLRSKNFEVFIFVSACLLFIGILTFANYRYSVQSPGGNDFIPRWLGTRLLLTEGHSPYSASTTQAIQDFMTGGAPEPGQDQNLFAYPLYAILIFMPYALISDFVYARAFWLTTLQVMLVLTAWLGSRLAKWKLSVKLASGLLLYALIWYYSVRPMINGNAAIAVGLFLAISLMAIRNHHDILAGFFLALTTIKPQAVILVVPLILLWAVSRRRWRIVASLAVAMLVLIGFATILLPDWIFQMFDQVRAYPSYTVTGTPAEIFGDWWPEMGVYIGWFVSAITIVIVFVVGKRSWGKDFNQLLPLLFLVLAATNFIGISTATSNHAILFPGLLLVFGIYHNKFGARHPWWIIIFALLLLVGIWVLFFATIQGRGQPSIMYFPLPLLLIATFLLLGEATSSGKHLS